MTDDELQRRFQHHPPDERRVKLHEEARSAIREAAYAITEGMQDSRELSLAVTHLEEALFWANAHIARNVR